VTIAFNPALPDASLRELAARRLAPPPAPAQALAAADPGAQAVAAPVQDPLQAAPAQRAIPPTVVPAPPGQPQPGPSGQELQDARDHLATQGSAQASAQASATPTIPTYGATAVPAVNGLLGGTLNLLA